MAMSTSMATAQMMSDGHELNKCSSIHIYTSLIVL